MQTSVGAILKARNSWGFQGNLATKLSYGPQNVDWQGISLPCTSASGFSLKCSSRSLTFFEVNQNKPYDRAWSALDSQTEFRALPHVFCYDLEEQKLK